MPEELWSRIKRWFAYAKKHPVQGAVLLMIGIPAIVIIHLAQHRLELWGDDLLVKYGGPFLLRSGLAVLNFIAAYPLCTILIFLVAIVFGLIVHAYIATLRTEDGETTKTAKVKEVSPSDPRIYVEIDDERNGKIRQTPIRLCNRGGDVAHKIEIAAIDLQSRGRTISFPKLDRIDAGKDKTVIPFVENTSIIFQHDVLAALLDAAYDQQKSSEEKFVVSTKVKYQDHTGRRRFIGNIRIICYTQNMVRWDDRPDLRKLKPLYEVENDGFTLVS